MIDNRKSETLMDETTNQTANNVDAERLVQKIDLPWRVGGVFAAVELPLTLRISNVETRSDVLQALNSLFGSDIREKIECLALGDGLWLSREGTDMQITLGWRNNPEAIEPTTEIWDYDE